MPLRYSDGKFASRINLSPLKCAVADKHRVLPVFSRNRLRLSPLECALLNHLISADSKWFTAKLNLLESALTKNRGVGVLRTFQRSTFQRSNDPSVPLQPNAFGATIARGAKFLHDPGKQVRSPRCLTVRERTSGTVHRRSRSQVVPGS